MTTLPNCEYWSVTWHIPSATEFGMVHEAREATARDERDARSQAQSASRRHGTATVTNQEGLVATYVNGKEWHPSAAAESQGSGDRRGGIYAGQMAIDMTKIAYLEMRETWGTPCVGEPPVDLMPMLADATVELVHRKPASRDEDDE